MNQLLETDFLSSPPTLASGAALGHLICFDLSTVLYHFQGFIHALSTVQHPSSCVAVGKEWGNPIFQFFRILSSFKHVGSGHIQQTAMVDHADIRGLITT
jgi:hypothetical protein